MEEEEEEEEQEKLEEENKEEEDKEEEEDRGVITHKEMEEVEGEEQIGVAYEEEEEGGEKMEEEKEVDEEEEVRVAALPSSQTNMAACLFTSTPGNHIRACVRSVLPDHGFGRGCCRPLEGAQGEFMARSPPGGALKAGGGVWWGDLANHTEREREREREREKSWSGEGRRGGVQGVSGIHRLLGKQEGDDGRDEG